MAKLSKNVENLPAMSMRNFWRKKISSNPPYILTSPATFPIFRTSLSHGHSNKRLKVLQISPVPTREGPLKHLVLPHQLGWFGEGVHLKAFQGFAVPLKGKSSSNLRWFTNNCQNQYHSFKFQRRFSGDWRTYRDCRRSPANTQKLGQAPNSTDNQTTQRWISFRTVFKGSTRMKRPEHTNVQRKADKLKRSTKKNNPF